jgi:hypothetical protein
MTKDYPLFFAPPHQPLESSSSSSSTSSSSHRQQPKQQPQRSLLTTLTQGAQDINVLPDNTCQVWSQLDTNFNGDRTAFGTMFSITAKQDIEVLTFEFAHLARGEGTTTAMTTDGQQPIEVYVKPGADFLSGVGVASEWTSMMNSESSSSATTTEAAEDGTTTTLLTAYESPGAPGTSIIPTASLKRVKIATGESVSFYITLTEPRMKVSLTEGGSGLTTSAPYVEDEYVQLSVGVGLQEYPFPNFTDLDRVFHGLIHYRTTANPKGLECIGFSTTTVISLKFAVQLTATVDKFKSTVTEVLSSYLVNQVELRKMAEIHNLALEGVTEVNLGPAEGGTSTNLFYRFDLGK